METETKRLEKRIANHEQEILDLKSEYELKLKELKEKHAEETNQFMKLLSEGV